MSVALKKGVTEVKHHPVSSRVNAAANDDEALIRELGDREGQG
jgi:hypothetical protein